MMDDQRRKRLQEDLENRLMNKAAAVACWCHNSQNKGVFPETPADTSCKYTLSCDRTLFF